MNLILKVHSKLSLLFAVSAILLLVPALSSAQERIAFSATADNNSDIWSTNTDGTDPKRLTTNAASDIEPSFSADGGKIAFVSFRDGNAEIYVMNADGTDQKRLTTNTVADLNPVWSHNGAKMATVRQRSWIYLRLVQSSRRRINTR
jgi:Tol biopolymer transport system component